MRPLRTVPSLTERVHLRLVDAIADGSLRPNQRLNQQDVAKMLCVSRQPVSHALQLLKRQGLVVEQGRRGLAVAPVEADWIRNLYQVRAALDGLAARLAAERVEAGTARPSEIELLQSRFAAARALGDGGDTHEWIAVDVAFHASIYALSGNPAIAETVADRWPHFKRGMGVALASPAWRSAVWVEHAAITGRILAGDSAGASTAAVNHSESAGAALHAQLIAQTDQP